MNSLNKINSKYICSIDIETVRIYENYNQADDNTKMAWEYKNKLEGIIPTEDELSKKWEESASLYAEFSKICSISVSFIHNELLYCKEFYGNNEIDILLNFNNMLKGIQDKGGYRLVGHSAKFFDYPFICKRCIANELEIPDLLDVTHLKPWEGINIDTNDLWKMGGTGYGASLVAVCNTLNIPLSKQDMTGGDVGKAYFENRYKDISRYCSYDAIATFNIIRKLKRESLFSFDDVVYIDGMNRAEVVQKVEQTPLQKLHSIDYFSDDIKEQLTEKFSKKKLTKKDKIFIEDVLKKTYIKTDMFSSDSADVVEAKTSEIVEFIKTL